ncbi:MAG TPA: hypothetical protein VI643_03890 [Planctomycetota bacterium]|nr:hypothetical protein [Planctomycetota bacterium]
MALTDRVTARVSTDRLVKLTNPQEPDGTTVDTTRLGLAATDVQAAFKRYAKVEYDDTNDIHVETGVPLVVLKLQVYAGQLSWQEADRQIRDALRTVADVGGGDRILPTTTSDMDPTQDRPLEKPSFDKARFRHYVVGNGADGQGSVPSDVDDS